MDLADLEENSRSKIPDPDPTTKTLITYNFLHTNPFIIILVPIDSSHQDLSIGTKIVNIGLVLRKFVIFSIGSGSGMQIQIQWSKKNYMHWKFGPDRGIGSDRIDDRIGSDRVN